MKYDITYSCGHQGEVDLFGKSRDRERKVKYLETCICPACQAKKIKKEAKDAGLPELEGSEKQIHWALEIRKFQVGKLEDSVSEMISDLENKELTVDISADLVAYCINDAAKELKNQTSAHWWIYHREDDMGIMLAEMVMEMLKEMQSLTPSAAEAQEEEKNQILYPEDKASDTVVEIHVDDQRVVARSKYEKTMVDTVKAEGLWWNPSRKTWELKIYEGESPQDCAAHVGNILLRAGFPVLIRDPEIREKAVTADFPPVQEKWIDRFDDDHLILIHRKNIPELYNAVMAIQGSKYHNRQYILPASSAEEIRDFASMMDCSITRAAEKVMKNYEDSILIVAPEVPARKEGATQEEKLQQILESDRGVLDDLKEDDL